MKHSGSRSELSREATTTGTGSGPSRKRSVFDLSGPKRATTFEAILHLKSFYPKESVGKIASWMMKSWDKGKG